MTVGQRVSVPASVCDIRDLLSENNNSRITTCLVSDFALSLHNDEQFVVSCFVEINALGSVFKSQWRSMKKNTTEEGQ